MRILSWQNFREQLCISFEQCVDRLGHLTRYLTDDSLLPNAGLRLFVIWAPSQETYSSLKNADPPTELPPEDGKGGERSKS